jgi:putative ABC transport system permease protein
MRSTTAGYFASLNIPVRRGRLFSMSAEDGNTLVINDAAAARMFGDADPLGQQMRFGQAGVPPTKDSPWLTVIGVVGSDRHERVSTPPNPEVFQPYQSNSWGTMTVVAGTDGDPATLAPGVRNAMHEIDPRLAVVNLAPVSTFFDGQLERPRFGAEAAALLAVVGLVLAAFGIFGVLSLLVSQRTREIGIRMALGSTAAGIGGLLVRESLVPVAAGCLVGGLAAAALARALGSELFGVTATDPWTFAVAIVTLVATAIVAVWRPARRAMGVNPITALRAE